MKVSHLSLAYGVKKIYDDASFILEDDDKVGIVGVNGAGKTTLIKILRGELVPDSAEIDLPGTRFAYLPQEIATTDEDQEKTVWEYIKEGRPVDSLQEKLNQEYEKLAKHPTSTVITDRITALQDLIDSYDLATYDYDLLKITEKMHLDDLLDRKMRDLSGGQKSKVAFAKVLFENASLLLLDEPTNHLDADTKTFVENYLRNYHGTVLIVSHDQSFLDQITTKTLFINKTTHKIKVYSGNYSAFRRLYAEEKAAEDQRIANEEREIKYISEFVERARAAKRSNYALIRQGHIREKILEKKLAALETREAEYKKVSLDLTPRRNSSKKPLEVQNLTFSYPNSENLYNELNFSLTSGEKFLIVGENGVGKSTLLKLIVGQLQPTSGYIIYGHNVDTAYYAQEFEILDEHRTILENLKSYDYTDTELRSLLSNFLFNGDDVFKPVSVLSPGEKARVAMAKILSTKPNFIILDEPTNHLDPETQRIIGDNFRDFPGTLIVVSHNPSFVEQIGITRMLIIPSDKNKLALIKNYSRELLDYYYYLNSDLV
jgi:ATP-binding cassette subfamily F protein 3